MDVPLAWVAVAFIAGGMFGLVVAALCGATRLAAAQGYADSWRECALRVARHADKLEAELRRLRDEQRQAGERAEVLAILRDEPGSSAVVGPADVGMETTG